MGGNEPERLAELKDIFGIVNQWLKFAETKNAALVAFNGVIVSNYLKIYTLLFEKISLPCFLNYLAIYFYAFLVLGSLLSLFLALISFLPQTGSIFLFLRRGEEKVAVQKLPEANRNTIFYTHLQLYENDIQAYLKGLSESSRIERDYANQILANAKIVAYKFKMFKYALQFVLFAVFNILGLILFWVIDKKLQE